MLTYLLANIMLNILVWKQFILCCNSTQRSCPMQIYNDIFLGHIDCVEYWFVDAQRET